jgi:hypothetical protein
VASNAELMVRKPSHRDEAALSITPLRQENGRPFVGRFTVRALRGIAEAVFSTHAGGPPADRIDWVMLEIEDLLARAGPQTRFVIRAATLAVTLLAPLSAMRLRPLYRLPLRERVRALVRFERTRFGAPLLAVKALMCLVYYEHPDASRDVGFDGACLGGSG